MGIRKVLLATASALALVWASGSAYAGTLTISDTTGRTGSGGEFKITGYDNYFLPPDSAVTSLDGGQFNTFCIERNEYLDLPGSYNYSVATGAINGGVGGGNPDRISDATAKLYYTFWTNKWSVTTSGSAAAALADLSYNYANTGGTRGLDGADLQTAIWWLEDELLASGGGRVAKTTLSAGAQAFIAFAEDADLTWSLLGQSDWNADGSGNHNGGVKAINLVSPDGTKRQSQLVIVPLPAGALMGFALLGALGIAKRVRSRRQNSIV